MIKVLASINNKIVTIYLEKNKDLSYNAKVICPWCQQEQKKNNSYNKKKAKDAIMGILRSHYIRHHR